jgi:hypothetical protein
VIEISDKKIDLTSTSLHDSVAVDSVAVAVDNDGFCFFFSDG